MFDYLPSADDEPHSEPPLLAGYDAAADRRGRLAYQAYQATVRGRSTAFEPARLWRALPPYVRAGWTYAASVIRADVIDAVERIDDAAAYAPDSTTAEPYQPIGPSPFRLAASGTTFETIVTTYLSTGANDANDANEADRSALATLAGKDDED